uniref:Uncharacterized protein n=1 Tax=Mesocestoides corti TaxID=53468 RepID=A0A5K3EH80_MESCO
MDHYPARYGVRECQTGYFNNYEQCGEPSQKPTLCLSAIKWHGRKINSHPDTARYEKANTMSGMASVMQQNTRAVV